jgi:YidC/Oxa1 family membrane protein insertase
MMFIRALCVLLFLLAHFGVSAGELSANASRDVALTELVMNDTDVFIKKFVQEHYTFYGLASYYNNVNYFIVESDGLLSIDNNNVFKLHENQWFAAVGRFNVLLIKASSVSFQVGDTGLKILAPEGWKQQDVVVKLGTKPELPSIAPELNQIRYSHLWGPLAWLSKCVEFSVVAIQTYIVSNWGLAIVVFSILLKLALLPVGVMTVRFQRRVSQIQFQIAPHLSEIKKHYKGEEAHNRLMAVHKSLGVTPFFTLKPMLGSFIQVPILVAVFNALGEMPQFQNQSFLWMDNLAYPDVIFSLPFSVPMFGDVVSLLPLAMTAITLISTLIYKNPHAPESEIKRQKRNLYLMAASFLVLFYPFPAAMVLYWALANILQTIQQQIIRI